MKMLIRQRKVINLSATVILLIWLHDSATEARRGDHTCPLGFNLSYTRDRQDPICYRLKGPESFTDKFHDCAGNLYTHKLYTRLYLNKSDIKLWAEYKSLYPGGPFIDWSYANTTGDILTSTFEVKYDRRLGIEEELCTIITKDGLKAVSCDEQHYRYCFVSPYDDFDDMSHEGCEELPDYWRFWSPKPTCLTAVVGVGGGTVRATWDQSQELCARRNGSLLQRGWRYANNMLLHESDDRNVTDPLGIIMASDDTLMWIDPEDGNSVVPDTEWNFRDESYAADTSLVALREGAWHLVNSSYIFYDVICERSIHLRNVSLMVSYDNDDKLGLTVNDSSVDENNIWCFSDSVIFYPSRVKLNRIDDSNEFVLKPLTDGYYWCIHADSKNFRVSESNKALFIREKSSVMNLYTIKIRVKRKYSLEILEKNLKEWSEKLSEYIFLQTKFKQVNGYVELSRGEKAEDILRRFKEQNVGSVPKESVFNFLKVKRLFLDRKTILLHAQVNSGLEAVVPGEWEDLEIVFMKSAYYCKGFDNVPTLALGTATTLSCRTYSCVGDFNEGVQWVATAVDGCGETPRLPVVLRGSMEFQEEVTPPMPTVFDARATLARATNPYHQINEDTDSLESGSPEKHLNLTTIAVAITTANVTTVNTPTEEVSTVNTPTEIVTVPPCNPPIEIITEESPPTENVTEDTPITTRPPFPIRPPTTMVPPIVTMPPRPPPQEQLQNVMENLEQLLHNDSYFVGVQNIQDAFDEVDNLLEVEEALDIPGQFLHLLDQLGTRADLNGSRSAVAVRNNIALLMADSMPNAPVRGLQIAARQAEQFNEDDFQILTAELDSTHLDGNASEVVVYLPTSVAESERRISFVVFRTDRAFRPTESTQYFAVNSRVLSVNVDNVTQFEDGEVIDLHFRPMTSEIERNNSRACAYWHFLDDGTGVWSTDGCTFIPAKDPGMLDTCRCTHLTHFAEILVPRTVFSEGNERALEILSVVGCAMSIFGLAMIGLTAAVFRSWRRDFSNKIWLQLCIAILFLVLCFLIIVFVKFQEYNIPCMLVGIALHYSVLSAYCWMLVSAVLSYRRLVLVFTRDASHKLLRASAFAWGAPCAMVGILLSAAPHSYAGRFEEMTPTGVFCYPSGLALWLTVYAPIALMLLANWTLFALIVRSVFASRRIQRHGDQNEALRCASVSCLLVFLFGLPWVFGLFASNIVGAYLFAITSTFQGFVLFIFFIVGNKKTRDLWLNKLKIKQTRKVPVTSSTYNKSSGTSWRGGSGRGTAIEVNLSKPRSLATTFEANVSKPRALSASDDLRFS